MIDITVMHGLSWPWPAVALFFFSIYDDVSDIADFRIICRMDKCPINHFGQTSFCMAVPVKLSLYGHKLLIFWSKNGDVLEMNFFCLSIYIWRVGK